MSPSQCRLIRIAGIGIAFTLMLLRSLLLLQQHVWLASMSHATWLIPMACFVVTLWMSTSTSPYRLNVRHLLLAAQSVSVLVIGFTMGGQRASNYEGALLLVVAVEIALTMPLAVACLWIVAQTSILAVAYVIANDADVISAAVSILFKLFTYAIVMAIKFEADERARIAELNAQMMASREVYAEHSRSRERLRISRDLHDVLGHRLTALSLNLEIAIHKATASTGLPEIQRAQTVTKDLLTEVREVVSTMRPTSSIDLRSALERVAQGFTPIRVHLEFSMDEVWCDAARGEVLVRCAQELITNAVKHGRAHQVWILVEMSEHQVLKLSCHDDGSVLQEQTSPKGAGTGLLFMRERFEFYGGEIEASISPTNGFTIRGFLPMMLNYPASPAD